MAKMRLERQSQALGVFMPTQRSLDSERQKPSRASPWCLLPATGSGKEGQWMAGGERGRELRTKPATLSCVILELPRLHLVSSTWPGPRGPSQASPDRAQLLRRSALGL